MAARTGAAGLGGGSVWPSGQPEIIVVMFDLISEGLAKHLVMPMGGHNVGVMCSVCCLLLCVLCVLLAAACVAWPGPIIMN